LHLKYVLDFPLVINEFPEDGTLLPKYVGVDIIILNNNNNNGKEKGRFLLYVNNTLFPYDSGRTSLTLSKCTSTASIQNLSPNEYSRERLTVELRHLNYPHHIFLYQSF